ncbi:Transport protein particle subunit trs31 [Smittium mucronatum]|uniref:Transport protein particle subunit trs31 n=1 Tax=Smittium mucronatum TaxID=133383 RepID=A0A1R0H711_9FUNG|nr:Transport protein particle subunit trs31 [Smittium mucronatum]
MMREKVIKREIRVLNVLLFINTVVWKYLFGKPADSLEKSTENKDEYMLTDNDPLVSRFISVPKDMASFSPCSFVAGVVEAIMDSCQCPARVTAHTVPVDGRPHRTVILMKIEKSVLDREERLGAS